MRPSRRGLRPLLRMREVVAVKLYLIPRMLRSELEPMKLASRLGRGAADGDAIHAHGGLADADRHALAVLAAGTDAVVEP
jgi:hypothetical protein